jgi:hypothetical protein
LVVYLPLWNIWKSVGIIVPNIYGKIKHPFPNHQPVYIRYIIYIYTHPFCTDLPMPSHFRCFPWWNMVIHHFWIGGLKPQIILLRKLPEMASW